MTSMDQGTGVRGKGGLIAGIVSLAFLFATILYTQPRFQRMLWEMGVPLPALTQWFFRIPLAGYVLMLCASTAVLLWKERALRDAALRRRLNYAAVAAGILGLIVYIVALFLPLILLLDGGMQG